MKLLRGLCKTAVAAFCIWHMVAVGIYSLYTVDGYPLLEWLDSKRKHVRPYVLATSQWQRWNLFSPDPLRSVIEMDFEMQVNGKWHLAYTLNQHTVSWWQRAPELKTMRRMENVNLDELREVYIQDLCKRRGIPPGTPMRVAKRWFVIPRNDKTQSREWWNAWYPEWRFDILQETSCSANA